MSEPLAGEARVTHYLWELRPYFRQVAGQLALGSVAGFVMNTAVVLPAILLGRAIDRALALERGEATPADVGWAVLIFLGGTLLTEGPRIAKRWWLQSANARIRANLRADAFRGVLAWPMARLHTTPVGEVMARIVGDVEVLGVGIREFVIETWDTVLFSVSLVVAMLIIAPSLTLLAVLPVPCAMLLAHATGRWVSARTTRAREANAALTSVLQEHLAGVRVLRLFGRAGDAVERVARLSRRVAEANVSAFRLKGGLLPIYTTLTTAGVIVVIWRGSADVIAGAMTVGGFVAYLELFLRFVNRGHRIPQLVNSIQSGGAAYARLRPLLAPALSVAGEPPRASFHAWRLAGIATPAAPAIPARAGAPAALSLRDVTFRYPGAPAPALRGLDLDVAAGALVGVTGPVGSGKSALMRAIVGCYPLESGAVRIDGRPIEAAADPERAGLLGYLPQDPVLFSGTVRDNVALAPADGREGELATALRLAALDEDLRAWPRGLDTDVGELGVRISGGQRQRIGLARAIAASGSRPPRLLVLDDPFAAVDVATEAAIVAALREAFGPAAPVDQRATIVLSSHRLAAFPQADAVVVLQDGRVAEAGTHAELLAADGLYARIFRAQRVVESSVGTVA